VGWKATTGRVKKKKNLDPTGHRRKSKTGVRGGDHPPRGKPLPGKKRNFKLSMIFGPTFSHPKKKPGVFFTTREVAPLDWANLGVVFKTKGEPRVAQGGGGRRALLFSRGRKRGYGLLFFFREWGGGGGLICSKREKKKKNQGRIFVKKKKLFFFAPNRAGALEGPSWSREIVDPKN